MRLSSGWAAACVVLAGIAHAGCTTERTTPDAGGPTDSGGGGMDAGLDAGMRRCTTDPECDDAIACTADSCAVGNICRNTPLDELCAAEERCVVGVGCRMGMPSACTVDDDCSDGAFCNGVERCVGPAGSRTCVMGTDIDCDDGNACTVDACDEDIDGCTYSIAPGCDAGTSVTDGGIPCEPFDPATGYAGTFSILPPIGSACPGASWSLATATFSVVGGELRVTSGGFTLTQSPAPTGPDFVVRSTAACASHELTGTFMCANRFRGTWRVTFGSGCPTCGSTSTTTVAGIRR